MIVYVHAAGMDDVGLTFGRHARVPRAEVRHIVLPRIAGQDWVDLVIEQLPARGSLFLLVINCHGVNQPGIGNLGLQLGTGTLSETGLLTIDGLASLSRLSGWFSSPNQGVEIHACQIARGGGRKFCQRFANLCGANVYAGLALQIGTEPGADEDSRFAIDRASGGGPDSWGWFEGPVLCFSPGSVAPGDASADLMARGAWRAGAPALRGHSDIDEWEIEHALAPPNTD